jgi:hypothetical protein
VITKIISGGQTGVDLARELGIPTGGWAARGWKTEDGPAPILGRLYGLTEAPVPGYPARTRCNVEDAHATLILTHKHPLTGGTRLTYDLACPAGERGAGLYVALLGETDPGECLAWLQECVAGRAGFVLNVAGPRESKCPGIYRRAVTFLLPVLCGEGG